MERSDRLPVHLDRGSQIEHPVIAQIDLIGQQTLHVEGFAVGIDHRDISKIGMADEHATEEFVHPDQAVDRNVQGQGVANLLGRQFAGNLHFLANLREQTLLESLRRKPRHECLGDAKQQGDEHRQPHHHPLHGVLLLGVPDVRRSGGHGLPCFTESA